MPTEIISSVTEFIKEFKQLSTWTAAIVLFAISWKLFLASLLEKWFSHKLEMHTNDIANALEIQKEIAIKKAEFESVKLNKALPLLEKMSGLIYSHNMLFSEYTRATLNNIQSNINLESKRLEIDNEMINVLSSIAIYIPKEFRDLIITLRKIISCSWRDSKILYSCLKSIGPIKEQISFTNEYYYNSIHCFHDMCSKYIGAQISNATYADILENYGFNIDATPLLETESSALVWKFILLHEYFGSSEQVEAQNKLEMFFKKL